MNKLKKPQYREKTAISASATLLSIKSGESTIIDGAIIKILTVFTTVYRLNRKKDQYGESLYTYKASVEGLDNKVLVTRIK